MSLSPIQYDKGRDPLVKASMGDSHCLVLIDTWATGSILHQENPATLLLEK